MEHDSRYQNLKEIRDKNDIINRNIAIYLNGASNSPTLELHFSVIRDLLSRGNKITAYESIDSFKSPTDNPFNRKSISRFAKFRIKDASAGLNIELRAINLENEKSEVNDSIAEILELGVMSSFASILKVQSKEHLNPIWRAAYENMLQSGKKIYNFFTKEIEKEGYEFVFMYNGRFGDVRPVLEATRDSKAGFGLYDMKRVINEIVFINELVHSIEGNNRRAIEFYEKDKDTAMINARKFFKNKEENKPTGDHIYTKNQEKGSLPEAVTQTDKIIIAIFPSSDDEFKFIGKEWDGLVPEDQAQEIDKLAAGLPYEKYLIVIKMHPNQSNAPQSTIDRYTNLTKKHSHVIVETPRSKKDTYALMHRADVVVTFASTVGVEACNAGKPVVLIGDTNWGKLDIAYKVYSGTEAAKLIQNGVVPKPILGTIIWGNYMLSYKDNLPAFKFIKNGDYLVDGRKIGKSALRRMLQWPAKLELELRKPGFKFGFSFLLRMVNTLVNIFKGNWANN